MLTRPPRREPRLAAIALRERKLVWVVCDPFEIRSAGELPITRRALRDAIHRLVKREKPTVIASPDHALGEELTPMFRRLGLSIVAGRFPPLPVPVASELYPELPIHCPTRALAKLATVALSAMLHAPRQPRHYAKTIRPRTPLHGA